MTIKSGEIGFLNHRFLQTRNTQCHNKSAGVAGVWLRIEINLEIFAKSGACEAQRTLSFPIRLSII
jgi:hypothetical protein